MVMKPLRTLLKTSPELKLVKRFICKQLEGQSQQCASQVNHSVRGYTRSFAVKLSLESDQEPF